MRYFKLEDKNYGTSIWALRLDGKERCLSSGKYLQYINWTDPTNELDAPINEAVDTVEITKDEAFLEMI